MHTKETTNVEITLDNDNVVVFVIPETEWELHKQRVESLCNLLEKLFGALANNPMFQAMIPPDVLAELRNK